ncbi:putative transporter small subunit [Marinobacterium marinum]|nr:putative transporter small subunit [Marinobacterium marinum]
MTSTWAYAAYILIWPALTLGVLTVICRAVIRDINKARKAGKDLI